MTGDLCRIPGEVIVAEGELVLNAGREVVLIEVANTSDRPVQVGSHYHFAETNPALAFDRGAARGMRLDIAAGTAVRFELGQRREVRLIAIGGKREIYGFKCQGDGAAMKTLAILMTLGLASGAAAQSADCANQVTQLDMNECAARAFDVADAELNRLYAIAVDYARQIDADTEGGIEEKLRIAQRAWITYRDAACDSEASQFIGGSVQPLVYSGCLERATLARTDDLYVFTANY